MNNKVVVITGAKGGLGTFTTQAFLNAGATVIGVSRSISQSAFSEPAFIAMPAELSSAEEALKLTEAIVEQHGRIDVLVHLVGSFAGGKSVAETDDKLLDQLLETNLRSALHMMAAVLPHMQKQKSGRILAIGSRLVVEPVAMAAAYTVSKAALLALVRAVAIENKEHGITANIVLPGTMDTPANRAAMPQVDPSTWVQPEQVASLLVHLASDSASQITGAAIPI